MFRIRETIAHMFMSGSSDSSGFHILNSQTAILIRFFKIKIGLSEIEEKKH